ncbi:MAG: hypothetical protein ICV85_20900 [Tolypothrix sp. T3-bin4]|nr:hypothetical protein [Tolypothrix sp. T3-bin4]
MDEIVERDGHVGDFEVVRNDNVILKAAATIRDVAATAHERPGVSISGCGDLQTYSCGWCAGDDLRHKPIAP